MRSREEYLPPWCLPRIHNINVNGLPQAIPFDLLRYYDLLPFLHTFPELWKKANVFPVHEKKRKTL